MGGKPLRVALASCSGSDAGLPLAGLPLAGLPLAGLPLAGLPLAGLPPPGPLMGPLLAELLLLAAAVGSVPGSHAGQVPPAGMDVLQAGHFRQVCCCQVSRSLAIGSV